MMKKIEIIGPMNVVIAAVIISTVTAETIRGNIAEARNVQSSIQSRSSNGGFGQQQQQQTTNRNSFTARPSYSSAAPAGNSYGSPTAPPINSTPPSPDNEIKILPLPIPVALPVPNHGSYGYDNYKGPNPLAFGLFAGFGGPFSKILKDEHGDDLGPLLSLLGSKSGLSRGRGLGLGYDPIKASILASQSNPLVHLLAAPYIKNIKENDGADLPSLDDLQTLLERSTFGLSTLDDL